MTTTTLRAESTQMAVEAFRTFADLVSTGTLPPPHSGPIYRWASSVAEVEEFAAKHGVTVKVHGTDRKITSARIVVGRLSPAPGDELEYVIAFAEDAS
jgi:hypothetical protein